MILALLCSPKANGVTDSLGQAFLRGAASGGAKVQSVALRDYGIIACKGCGACGASPHNCVLASKDDAEMLFSLLLQCQAAVFFSPVYFYHIPAHFKALVDRGQRFWAAGANSRKKWPVASVMACGRQRGEKLFVGAQLTLKYFCNALGARLELNYGYRGLDCRQDLEARPEILREQFDFGQKLAASQC